MTTTPESTGIPDLTGLTEAVQQLERRGEQVLQQMQRRTRQIWVGVGLLAATLVVAIVVGAATVRGQGGEQDRIKAAVEQQTASDCPFYGKVAVLPFTAPAAQELGQLARDTYAKRGCSVRYGDLRPAPTPTASPGR